MTVIMCMHVGCPRGRRFTERLKYHDNHLLTMSQVTVTDHVKASLKYIQIQEQHTSIDSVIRMLIMRSGYDDKQ